MVNLSASEAIFRITGDPTDAIKVGLDLLDDDEWMERYVAAEHLGRLGAKAHSAVSRLRWAAIEDEKEAVQDAAQSALHKIEAYRWQSQT